MTLINRSALVAPDLKRETRQVDALGGEVAVVELDLTGRLTVESVAARQDRADPAAVYATVPHVLAACVRDADDQPLMTVQQWQAFGTRHRNAAVDLFNVAMGLSGFDGEAAAKN